MQHQHNAIWLRPGVYQAAETVYRRQRRFRRVHVNCDPVMCSPSAQFGSLISASSEYP